MPANKTLLSIVNDSLDLYRLSFHAVLPIIILYFLIIFLVYLVEQVWLLDWVPIAAQAVLFLTGALLFPAILYRQWEWQSKTLKRRCYRQVFSLTLKRAHRNIGVGIAVTSIVAGPSYLYCKLTPLGHFYYHRVDMLLAVAGLLLAVNWILSPAFIMLEDRGLIASLTQSVQLMKKHWLRTVASLVICCLLCWLILKAAYYIFPRVLLLVGNGLAYVAHVDAVRFGISASIVSFQLLPALLVALPIAFVLINYEALAEIELNHVKK